MTLKELSQHFKLRERLEKDSQTLASLRAKAHPGAQALTGMPHTPGVSDKVGDLAIEIADIEERIRHTQEEIDKKADDVANFINTIDDGYMRTIMRLRFVRGLTWGEVTYFIGGNNTEGGIKAACYRFLAQ